MGSARISRSHWLALAGLVATLTIAAAGCDPAHARVKSKRDHHRPRAIHGPNYHPPYAAIVVDDKSGFVLHEISADEPRHPASLTKIMTLYLLFEQLEAGKLSLDTELPISTRAALQNPTKLGLKANQTIKVEDAIKGLVTKSANDAAVVVAEAIGGSEAEFAKLMTAKAGVLGMLARLTSMPRACPPKRKSRPPATRPFWAVPSSTASRSTTNILQLRAFAIREPRCATTTTCLDR